MYGVRSVGRQNELHTKTYGGCIYIYIYYGRNWRLQNLFSGNGQTITSTAIERKQSLEAGHRYLSNKKKIQKNRPSVWQTMFPRFLSTACWMHSGSRWKWLSGWVCWGRPYISFSFFFSLEPFFDPRFSLSERHIFPRSAALLCTHSWASYLGSGAFTRCVDIRRLHHLVLPETGIREKREVQKRQKYLICLLLL